MKEGDLPLTHFGSLEKDFKAEVTAAEMMELGIPPDRIIILMLGAMKRAMRKDVESIEEEPSNYDLHDYVVIKTPKEGFYDMLPEGLFHRPTAHRSASTVKEISKAIKRRKEEEQLARRFFLPFEATINHLRMQMTFYENRLDKRSHHDELVSVFADSWEIFHYLDAKQANLFLHLIPILHDIRDHHPIVETVIEIILGIPVKLRLRRQQPLRPSEPILSVMGESNLGVDLTTSNEVFDEGVDEILLLIGPVTGEQFQQFSEGQTSQKILDGLIDYLLPVHIDIVTDFELFTKNRVTKLAVADDCINSALGRDTYL